MFNFSLADIVNLIFFVGTSSIFMRIGKYLDFRLGPEYIANLKKRNRLEKYWVSLARQSTTRLATRTLQFVEKVFIRYFGAKPLSFGGLFRFTLFSLGLNSLLAVSAMLVIAPPTTYSFQLYGGMLPKFTAVLVMINVPLDLVAYLYTRYSVRVALNKSLSIALLLFIGAIGISYIAAALSTLIGGALTLFPLVNFSTVKSIIFPILLHQIPHVIAHPFTSNISLNDINAGYVAIGALPSIVVLISSLAYMLLLRTLAQIIHLEVCWTIRRLLNDQKSFFETIAMIFSALLLVIWAFCWVASQLI